MTASHASTIFPRAPHRTTLRLSLSPDFGAGLLDGAWWPRSHDLPCESADLVDRFPVDRGRIDRLVYSRPDWTEGARRIQVARGTVKAGCFPRDDTHVMLLSMSSRSVVRLFVVPPDTADADAHAVMTRAADGADLADADELMEYLEEEQDEPLGLLMWTDGGGSYWDPHPVAPSHRE